VNDKIVKPTLFTQKQQMFLKLWGEKNFAKDAMTECALKAGYTLSSAKTIFYQFLKYDSPMRKALLQAMEENEFSIENTVKEHKRITFESMHPFRPLQPDNEVRRKAVAMAYKLFDVDPPKRVEVSKAQQTEVELDFEDVQRIEDYTGEDLIDAEIIEEDNADREDMEPL